MEHCSNEPKHFWQHFVGPDQRHGYTVRLVGDITPSTPGIGKDNYGVLRGTPGQNLRAAKKSGPGRSAVLQYDAEVLAATCAYLRERPESEQPLYLRACLESARALRRDVVPAA